MRRTSSPFAPKRMTRSSGMHVIEEPSGHTPGGNVVVVVVGDDAVFSRATTTPPKTVAKTAAATIAGLQWIHQGTCTGWISSPNCSGGTGSLISGSKGSLTSMERYQRLHSKWHRVSEPWLFDGFHAAKCVLRAKS
ncbi:unannotated protein [freshwater metagenome]|uniref:Unannotated protein n=1 Tax=freshwater metagenome TaxID=449393 RepID=A0A6J6D7Y4_9ZZZZ